MTDGKVLFDTNVLVYAIDELSEKHEEALEAMQDKSFEHLGAVSVQNLAEFSRLLTEKYPRRKTFAEVRAAVLEMSEALEVIAYDHQTVGEALSMCAEYRLHFFDALIAAAMLKADVKTIVTENEKDFRKIPWMKVVNPFKPDPAQRR